MRFTKYTILLQVLLLVSCGQKETFYNNKVASIKIDYKSKPAEKLWEICKPHIQKEELDNPIVYFEVLGKDGVKFEFQLFDRYFINNCTTFNTLLLAELKNSGLYDWLKELNPASIDHVVIKIKSNYRDNDFIHYQTIKGENIGNIL